MKAIGDRMKENYENPSRHYLTRRVPVIIRVDGQAFHTYTKKLDKPFDSRFVASMRSAAMQTAARMQGFKACYVQSDEATFLLTDYDTLQTSPWFDYNKSKLETTTASAMSVYFSHLMNDGFPTFDARAFNIPREEVVNNFLWRALDWERNSLSMYARAFFSHKALHEKNSADMHEMLYGIGMNWTKDLDPPYRNGTWIFRDGQMRSDILPTYEHIAEVLNPLIYVDQACK